MPLNRTSPKLSLTASVGGTISPEKGLRLSRSPHPYHQRYFVGQKNEGELQELDYIKVTTSPSGNKKDEASYFDSKHKRGRSWSSSSDSGTEADDESGSGGILRGLPAPPLRLRKGIKDSRGLGTCSPLLTPSYLDEPGHRFPYNKTQKQLGDEQSLLSDDEESVRVRERFTRRRRAEFLRRMTETLLLGSVGCIACTKIFESVFRAWKRGNCLVQKEHRNKAEWTSRAARLWFCPVRDIFAIPLTNYLSRSQRKLSGKTFSLTLKNTCGL